ncbi:unnamed protein product [Caenorhabditis bovis]|uniref:Nucleoporin GLE1 n=1 Tax=Caenorhabditis bovis TaxID=2654633 RepID=A0A8S1F0R1_9PELO|nr:unnamed protein product [Caenorhabditis bovis]
MPTFGLNDDDEPCDDYLGDKDMYFRQWQLKSMKPVLEKKFDRDHLESVNRREEKLKSREERRRRHNEMFEKNFQECVGRMKAAVITDKKIEIPLLKEPTPEYKNAFREAITKEFLCPSSTAKMHPANPLPPKPRANPKFGPAITNQGLFAKSSAPLKALNPSIFNLAAAPRKDENLNSSFLNHSQESVFFPQENRSFRIDQYDGARPSFAFGPGNAQTSTPISKSFPKFSVSSQISEEDDSRYVTALESPIVKPQVAPAQTEGSLSGGASTQNESAPAPTTGKLFGVVPPAVQAQTAPTPVESAKNPENVFGVAPTFGNRFGAAPTQKESAPSLTSGKLFAVVPPSAQAQSESNQFGAASTAGQIASVKPTPGNLFGAAPAQAQTALTTGNLFGVASDKENRFGRAATSADSIKTPESQFGAVPASDPSESDSTPIQDVQLKEKESREAAAAQHSCAPPAHLTRRTMDWNRLGLEKQFQELLEVTRRQHELDMSKRKTAQTPHNPPDDTPTLGGSSASSQFVDEKPSSSTSRKSTTTTTTTPVDFKIPQEILDDETEHERQLRVAAENEPDDEKRELKFKEYLRVRAFYDEQWKVCESKLKAEEEEIEQRHRTSQRKPKGAPAWKMFGRYLEVCQQLKAAKKEYIDNSNEEKRALLTRTITEKVTVFTKRETPHEKRVEILAFFKNLLKKLPVEGYQGFTEQPTHQTVQLETSKDVTYAIICIIEKYISLIQLDSDLATTISDLISRLAASYPLVETAFTSLILKKSVVLRQDPEESVKFFEELNKKSADEKAMVINREKSLVELFMNVFVKCAIRPEKENSTRWLTHLDLWMYAEAVLLNALVVPKASLILTMVITVCKPRLRNDEDRWRLFIQDLGETIKKLLKNGFADDASINSNLSFIYSQLN